MIIYEDSLFGFSLIFRVHGSAVWKAMLPAVFSTGLMLVWSAFHGWTSNPVFEPMNRGAFLHPYPVTAYVAFFSFLLTFRLNFAYQRYWEGATAVHTMLSKWLDVATYMAAYHYQSVQYDKYRPPSFGNHQHLRNLTRERERESEITTHTEYVEELRASVQAKQEEKKRDRKNWWKLLPGASRRKHNQSDRETQEGGNGSSVDSRRNKKAKKISSGRNHARIDAPRSYQKQFAVTSHIPLNPMSASGKRYSMRRSPSARSTGTSALHSVAPPIQIPYPSLFLQETAHLVSLLAGVALSTLRNDIEGAPSPISEYFPGQPLPPVDPDELSAEVRKKWDSGSRTVSAFYYLLGLTRDDQFRTKYNAFRPFQILGGVSDAEIEKLQKAHGPYAKVSLCSFYVQEFAAREYLSGSTGKIPGPLISRITHVLSDGMSGYNAARKLAYVPFPFPHAQTTAFFTIAVLVIFPLLFYCFVNNLPFACVMNFVTVWCFLGIHEVARELENPMHNVPNDLPLTTYQAQFNEALLTIYAGFHPDSWWEVENNLAGIPATAEERNHTGIPATVEERNHTGIPATVEERKHTGIPATLEERKEEDVQEIVHPLKR